MEDLRQWLTGQRDVRVIWADRRTARVLPLFTTDTFGGTAWTGEIRVLLPGGPTPAADEHVVLYSASSTQVCKTCGEAAKKLFGDPVTIPAMWSQEYQTRDGILVVYRV